MADAGLPTGRVTLLFTDIEGSTRLLDALGDRFGDLVAEHRRVLREAVSRHGGVEVGTQGDGHSAVFTDGERAVRAAVDAQLALASHDWPDNVDVRVRMGLHTGDVSLARDEYYGMGLHAAARVSSVAHGGQILMSEDAVDDVRDQLSPDVELLDLGYHAMKDLGAPRRLYQVVHAGLARTFPPPSSLSVLPNNLPTALSTFVGREREIAEILDSLKTNRLVTVTGSGGVGKTRTCLQLAAGLIEEFEHGVWFVDLSVIEADDTVAKAVASALGVRDEPNRSMRETVEDRLRWQELLLILDNCEHVIDDCAHFVSSVLRNCARVVTLATTREPLAVAGEVVHRMEPFSAPGAAGEALEESTAVQLFVERAASATAGWVPGPAELPRVASICRRLDGLPLAIELAAARTDVLAIAQIEDRLSDPRFLSGRGRTQPERQRSLDALVDWSYNLLEPAHQAVLRRSAVFSGGFTLDAAEAVCASGEGVDVVEALSTLGAASLIVTARDEGSIRYKLLETVRSFSLGRLTEAGERRSAESAHCDYVVSLARRACAHLEAADQAEWLASLSLELANLSGAIEWSLANDPEAGVSIIDSLRRLWLERGHLHLALDWTRRFAEALPSSSLLQAELLANRGLFEGIVGDSDVAIDLLRRALELGASRRDDRFLERACSTLGTLHDRRGEHDDAEAMYSRAAEIASRLGDALAEGSALGNLGNVAFQRGDLAKAEELQLRALELATKAGADRVVANTWNNLGLVAWVRADLPVALERFEQAVERAREVGASGLAYALGNLAGVARDLGQIDRALNVQEEAVVLAEQGGDPSTLASSLVTLGTIRWDAGDRDAAVTAWTRSLDIARAGRLAHEQLTALLNLAQLALDDGELDRAQELAEEMLELARRSDSSKAQGDALTVLAGVALKRSEFDAAERLAEDASRLHEEVGDLSGWAAATKVVAEATDARGRYTDAMAMLTRVEERLAGQEGWITVPHLQLRIRMALRERDVAAAATAADLLAQRSDSMPPMVWNDCLELIAEARAAQG